jgi:ATP-dependent RNA helicase SUPV3L1/SUV3
VRAPITAVVGPTNTGKTHWAIERMLEHSTGMIGLPLRLLAREVYDRITARIGAARVALVTGEEKRVPRRPDYWVCTVEAMPMDREVDFLAVDEIQLAAHEERGHVFTERLLHGRGLAETWFLGSDTMEPLLREHVPTAQIASHPRLSKLSYAGADTLGRLPPRSALVAFSTPQVYELAERLRALRGGAAVVLGALSPRTRNAQVAMFQTGEVDYLVATDAIGMGLNLDLSHVAFASTRKFDGRDVRELDPAELGQIAGRAGRYLSDGTFGTLAPQRLSPQTAAAIEAHAFSPLRRLVWRNPELDMTSVDALLTSLARRPRARSLKRVESAEDMAALIALSKLPEVRARATQAESVLLLWEVCRIPDYRKLLLEAHVGLLFEIFWRLSAAPGFLDEDFLASRVLPIDDVSGDIETLLSRIASIRTWTYVTQRTVWVKDAVAWQERARGIEDHLSDALHERLVQRFVEKGSPRPKGVRSRPRPRGAPRAVEREIDPAHPFAELLALREALSPGPPAEKDEDEATWTESLVNAPHDALSIVLRPSIHPHRAGTADVLFQQRVVGRLVRGASITAPEVRLIGLDDLGAGARSRIHRRLVAFARDVVEGLLARVREIARDSAPHLRGIAYQLEQGLGSAPIETARAQLAALSTEEEERLQTAGITLGPVHAYLPALLRREAIELRIALAWAHCDERERPPLPGRGAVSFPVPREATPRTELIGYPVVGSRAIRVDALDRVARALATDEPPPAPVLASWLGCSVREAALVARELGAPAPSTSKKSEL